MNSNVPLYFVSFTKGVICLSKENDETVKVYGRTAGRYLENEETHQQKNPERAEQKRAELNAFIGRSFAPLPPGALIFEIGSGNGKDAVAIRALGYRVTASDTAPDFLAAIEKEGFEPLCFNAIKDEFPQAYHGIFCWRVFVHFTPEDARVVLKKSYAALVPGGRFVFNAMNRMTREVDNEWVDFPGDYHMGEDRHYSYHRDEDLRAMIAEAGFRIVDFHLEGGDANNKWLVYVLEK